MEKVFDSKACKVSLLANIPCVYIQWFGSPTSAEFQMGCDTALEWIIKCKYSKILTDNSQAKIFKVVDQHWLNDNWLPRAEKAGYKTSAVILGDTEAFVKFAVDNIVRHRDNSKFKTRYFRNRDEAEKWLKEVG